MYMYFLICFIHAYKETLPNAIQRVVIVEKRHQFDEGYHQPKGDNRQQKGASRQEIIILDHLKTVVHDQGQRNNPNNLEIKRKPVKNQLSQFYTPSHCRHSIT